jgi:hypothetical protein
MRISGISAIVLGVAFGTAPAFGQVGPTSSGDIWQAGTAPVSNLNVGRSLPNATPAAPAQPVSNQTSQQAPGVTGVPVGGGTLYPSVTAGAFFDDNVFATNSNRMSDWAFFERPELSWVRQGPNYTFAADGFVEGREYVRFSSEDQINGGIGAGFTVMPDNDTQILGSARYIHSHLDRGASETVVTTPAGSQLLSSTFAHPVSYDEGLESIALNKRYGNWWTSLGAAGLEIEYQNPTIGSMFGPALVAAGTPVDLSYADGAITSENGRLGRVIAPLTSVFVEAAANQRNWNIGYFDSDGYRVDGGVLFEQGTDARVKGEFWLGYMNQIYSGATMQNISTWTYKVALSAVLTPDVTAVVEGQREAKEAALGLAALADGTLGTSATTCTLDVAVCVSTIESVMGGRLDYRIMPNVVVGGGAVYLQDQYEGPLAFGRVDNTISPLASVRYFVNPNVTLAFNYRYVDFISSGGSAPPAFMNVAALPYDKNVYMVSLNAKW